MFLESRFDVAHITCGDVGWLVTESAGAVYGAFGSREAAEECARLLEDFRISEKDRRYVAAMRLGMPSVPQKVGLPW